MTKEQSIQQLELEIEQFDYLRMKKVEAAQEYQFRLQKELEDIKVGTLTRRGEIICLQRLITEEEQEKDKKKSKKAKRTK